MVYIRSQKFCCCIPVRFGVFIMSFLGILGGGFLSLCYWAACFHLKSGKLTLTQHEKIILFISTALYTTYTLVSLFGFIGCLARRRVLVQIYSGVSWAILGLSIVIGAVFLWNLYHADPTTAIEQCLKLADVDVNDDADNDAEAICRKGTKFLQGAERIGITIGLVVMWLVQIYGCHIVSSYVGQLEEEEDAYGRHRGGNSSQNVTSVNVMPVVASPLPTTYGQPYPFTQPPNSYGK